MPELELLENAADTALPLALSDEDKLLWLPAWEEYQAALTAKAAAAQREVDAVAVLNFLIPRYKRTYKLGDTDQIFGDGHFERAVI